jgi:DNA-binding FadR family transcriptional regulator
MAARPSPAIERSSMSVREAGGSKLAAKTADRIVDDVISGGWPVGQVLGSEATLLERYGVSRAVFREAVRLVEHRQVAHMRRGPGGGLVVTEPSTDAIIDAALLYLYRVDARLDEVVEARIILEELVVQLAPARLEETDIERLRGHVDEESGGMTKDHRAMHSLLAGMTRNPALELFVDLLTRVMLMYLADASVVRPTELKDAAAAHRLITDAVIGGDTSLAKRRMRSHLEAEAAFLRRRRSTRQVLDAGVALKGPVGGKRAEELTREIFYGVVSGRLAPGDLVGSEAELMNRFGVSRAIVREAVRLLEHHHIARMRRGPGGGLIVTEPSVAAVTDVVALYLERNGITVAHVFEVRMGVELAMVDMVIDGIDDAAVQRMHEAVEYERVVSDEEFTAAAHDLHAVIASISGNRVLELIAGVLIRLSRLHEVGVLSSKARRRVGTEVTNTHSAITAALAAKDRDLSRHRMQRHLEVLSGFFR